VTQKVGQKQKIRPQ